VRKLSVPALLSGRERQIDSRAQKEAWEAEFIWDEGIGLRV